DEKSLECEAHTRLIRGNERPYFQWFAQPSQYFRTVCSTLVTPTPVTGCIPAWTLLYIVVDDCRHSTCRQELQVQFFRIPQKPHKTQQNREIPLERPSLPVEICSGHQNTLEGVYRGLGSPEFPQRCRDEKARLKTGEGKRYGRLARSNEHSPSFSVSGSESGHAVQVRERAEDSGVQVGQPLALQEIEDRSVDGREVDGNGTAGQKENQGSRESCRNFVSKGGHMFGMGSKTIVGLDVGSSSIKAVELRKTRAGIEVAHLGLEPI